MGIINVHEKKLINEQKRQDGIEVHEQPVVRKVAHEAVVQKIQEKPAQIVIGEQQAELQKRLQMREYSQLEQPEITESRIENLVNESEELVSVQKNITKEVHNRKVITEIHEQPIVEIHEQPVDVIIYEKPIVRKIEHEVVYENVKAPPLVGLAQEQVEKREKTIQKKEKKEMEEKKEKKEKKSLKQRKKFTQERQASEVKQEV